MERLEKNDTVVVAKYPLLPLNGALGGSVAHRRRRGWASLWLVDPGSVSGDSVRVEWEEQRFAM